MNKYLDTYDREGSTAGNTGSTNEPGEPASILRSLWGPPEFFRARAVGLPRALPGSRPTMLTATIFKAAKCPECGGDLQVPSAPRDSVVM